MTSQAKRLRIKDNQCQNRKEYFTHIVDDEVWCGAVEVLIATP